MGESDSDETCSSSACEQKKRPQQGRKRRVRFNDTSNVEYVDPLDDELRGDLFYDSDDYRRFQAEDEARWQRAVQRRLRRRQRQREEDQLLATATAAIPNEDDSSVPQPPKEKHDVKKKRRHGRGKRKPSKSAPAA